MKFEVACLDFSSVNFVDSMFSKTEISDSGQVDQLVVVTKLDRGY